MHLQPNSSTSSIAGNPRAAKRGGALESRARGLADAQSMTNNPAGKTQVADTVDAGDQAGDRHGDGRQPRDTFERSDGVQQPIRSIDPSSGQSESDGESNHVDFQA